MVADIDIRTAEIIKRVIPTRGSRAA